MSELVELGPEECRGLLEASTVGRLAFVGAEGLRVVPVNYALNRDVLVFRTAPDSELGRFGADAEAAFEVDSVDDEARTGWSVVAYGRLARLAPGGDSWDISGWRNPTPWAQGGRTTHLELAWHTLTGRRLC